MGKNTKPYTETTHGNISIRTFDKDIDSGELTWHRDREDRVVEIIQGNNWKLQFDNQLPVTLTEGEKYFIPKGEYHRVIIGDGILKVKIIKTNIQY